VSDFKQIFFKIGIVLAIVASTIFVSCKNDIEKVNLLTSRSNMPAFSVYGFETAYSDSGRIMIELKAKEMSRYEGKNLKYDEYRYGLSVRFFDDLGSVSATLRCSYARFLIEKELWEIKSDVEIDNISRNEKINTELLYWDMTRELVYSDKFVRITTEDEILTGDGFESNQDFSEWKILKPAGVISIKDE
jgi:LPS export ABC transporter protein LptC